MGPMESYEATRASALAPMRERGDTGGSDVCPSYRLAMFSQSDRWRTAALVAAVVSAGCVALPTDVYVPDAGDGVLMYESCSLTPELPSGVKLEHSGLHAIVSIVRSQNVNLVRVQFDVPEGSNLVLRKDFVKITDNA